jgi:hypothetical protein
MNKLEDIFEIVSKESEFSIQTINDGIRYLSIWNNELTILINDIIGYNTEEILNENSLQETVEDDHISMEVATKVANLSKKIINLSKSINKLIQISDNNRELDQRKHNSFILQINSGINTIKTVQEMINSHDYTDLNDILIGLEKNFKKFYNAYITALNIVDPINILRRPENYN